MNKIWMAFICLSMILLSCAKDEPIEKRDCLSLPIIRDIYSFPSTSSWDCSYHEFVGPCSYGTMEYIRIRDSLNSFIGWDSTLRAFRLTHLSVKTCEPILAIDLYDIDPFNMNKVAISQGFFFPISNESAWEGYTLQEIDGSDNWIDIDESNTDGTEVQGTFQAAFVFDTTHRTDKKVAPNAPDIIKVTNGQFIMRFKP